MKNIFILLGVYILWRFITRVWQFRKILKQQQKNFHESQRGYTEPKKEGEVSVLSGSDKDGKSDNKSGEYVDYEEL